VAHRIAPETSLGDQLAAVSAGIVGAPIVFDAARLREILCPAHFVRIRETLGGPAPSRTAGAVRDADSALAADVAWLAAERTRLAAAHRERQAALEAL
jgi:hypothetical protein